MKKIIGTLLVSAAGIGQPIIGNAEVSAPGESGVCDDGFREFVLTADDPLFSCRDKLDFDPQQALECKKIVACMLEEGVVVEAGTLAKFVLADNVGSGTTGGEP